MSDTPAPNTIPGLGAPESEKMQAAFTNIAERSQKLLAEFVERYRADGPQPADPLKLTQTFMDFTAKMLADPDKLVQAQMELGSNTCNSCRHGPAHDGPQGRADGEPAKGDKRFNDPAWKDEVVLDTSSNRLLTARWLQGTVKEVQGVDDKTAQKVDFYTRQFIDALSPRTCLTNPCHQGHGREQGRESGEGPAEPADRSRARQGQARHQPDRHEGLQGRRVSPPSARWCSRTN